MITIPYGKEKPGKYLFQFFIKKIIHVIATCAYSCIYPITIFLPARTTHMQQQSIQHHLDAIRNILSMPPEKTMHERNKSIFTDIHTMSKKILKNNERLFPFNFIYVMIGLGLLSSNMIEAIIIGAKGSYIEQAPTLALMLCIYSIYVGHMQQNAISPRQKEITTLFVMMSTMVSLFSYIALDENITSHIMHAYLYGITFIYMIYILCMCKIGKNIRHQPITISDMFIHHDSHHPDHATQKAREHGGKLEWDPNDVIMLGHQSPVHPILEERNTTHADTRTILEQHLYHLSCQIPLIYITPSRNHIPHYVNITANPSNAFKEKTIKKYFFLFPFQKKNQYIIHHQPKRIFPWNSFAHPSTLQPTP